MTAIDIIYNRIVGFTGRNGYFMCKGLSLGIYKGSDHVSLYPITSKGHYGNCSIDIALDDVEKVIEALKTLKEVKE